MASCGGFVCLCSVSKKNYLAQRSTLTIREDEKIRLFKITFVGVENMGLRRDGEGGGGRRAQKGAILFFCLLHPTGCF